MLIVKTTKNINLFWEKTVVSTWGTEKNITLSMSVVKNTCAPESRIYDIAKYNNACTTSCVGIKEKFLYRNYRAPQGKRCVSRIDLSTFAVTVNGNIVGGP